jgi:pimeloyl-ACP methyl ester carboxylesterase
MGAPVEEQAQRLIDLGMTPEVATKLAAGAGAEMGLAILLLYRSARQPVMAQAGRDLDKAAARPGLCMLATEDHYVGSPEIRRRAAARAGARTEVLEGLGHWWMVQDPALSATVLTRFWESLD